MSSGLAQLWQAKRMNVACVNNRGGVKDEKNRSDRENFNERGGPVGVLDEMAFFRVMQWKDRKGKCK
jgi:hypothetical protein